MSQPDCDIVIPVYDQLEYTRACVESIFLNTSGLFRLIIVNDASRKQETIDYLGQLQVSEPARVLVLNNKHNRGYVGTVNYGLEYTVAPYVVVMNNDTLVYPGWLSEMIKVAESDPLIGIVNPQWEVPKEFKRGPEKFFSEHILPHRGKYIETDWARGCCYLTKRCVIDKIGGLDEDFAPAYYDDWDYSMRAMAAGYFCVRALGAFVFHFKNVTYSTCGINELMHEKGILFYRRWGKPLKLLVVDDGRFLGDVSVKLRELLKWQNRVVFISTRLPVFEHTNLRVIRVPWWLVRVAMFFVLINDARHTPVKRFHLVLSGERALLFFSGQDSVFSALVAKKKFCS